MATQEDIEKLLTEDLVDDYISKNRKDLEDMVGPQWSIDLSNRAHICDMLHS